MISLGYQSGYDGCWSVTEDVAFLIEEVLDESTVGDDEGGVCEAFEAEDTTELLRPLC